MNAEHHFAKVHYCTERQITEQTSKYISNANRDNR